MRVGALAPGWSVLFCLVLFLLVRIPVPPSGRLPAPLYREAGGARINIFIFVLYFIFSPRIACRGERRAPLLHYIFSDFLFLVIYRPTDPRGSILFSYTFSRYVSL